VTRRVLFPDSDWPLRFIVWKRLHDVANRLAWRYARPPGPTWGSAERINRRHPFWRLNDWLAARWTRAWTENRGWRKP